MKYLILALLCINPLFSKDIDTVRGETIRCERFSDYVVRCTANGVTCYEDEETGARYCFQDLATIKL